MLKLHKRVLVTCVLALPLLPVQADDMAVTDRLPAALAAIDISAATIVSADEAHRVRAEFFPSSGVVLAVAGVSNYLPHAATSYRLMGGGQDIVVGVSRGRLFFAADGIGILGAHSRVRGSMFTQSPNFTGVLTFEGSPTSADVVAYPHLFSVRMR